MTRVPSTIVLEECQTHYLLSFVKEELIIEIKTNWLQLMNEMSIEDNITFLDFDLYSTSDDADKFLSLFFQIKKKGNTDKNDCMNCIESVPYRRVHTKIRWIDSNIAIFM